MKKRKKKQLTEINKEIKHKENITEYKNNIYKMVSDSVNQRTCNIFSNLLSKMML